jgi:putative ABC transport system substrate-binding protein
LKEIVPGLSRVALLMNPDQATSGVFVQAMRAAARELGLVLRTFEVHKLEEIEPAFDAMVSGSTQAVTPVQGGLFFQARAIVPKLALARRLPMLAYSRESFEHGALVSYAADQIEMCRRSAIYADKILKGAKPGDLPARNVGSRPLDPRLRTSTDDPYALNLRQSRLLLHSKRCVRLQRIIRSPRRRSAGDATGHRGRAPWRS